MTAEELFSVPAERRDCPSDLALDRRLLGEAGPAETDALAAHLNTCTLCQARWALREKGAAAFPELDLDRVAITIAERRRAVMNPVARSWLPATVLALAAAAALFAIEPWSPGELGLKGAPGLVVYQHHNSGSTMLSSGAVVHPGDRLRFQVSASRDSEILIVCVEDSGAVSVFYPPANRRSSAIAAHPDGALPGSIVLDEHLGDEWLHLVACERPFSVDDLRVLSAGAIAPPKGCVTAQFHLKKRAL